MQYVYFLQDPQGSIKIGISHNVGKRISQLEQSLPYDLKLIGIMEGNLSLESTLHTKFESHRIKGEWFKPSDDILQFIKDNAKLETRPLNIAKAVEHYASLPTTPEGQECRKLFDCKIDAVEVDDGNTLITINQAAEMLGVTTTTLRNWDKNGKLTSSRTEGNQRRYNTGQIKEMRRKMMMGAEFVIPSITASELMKNLNMFLSSFNADERITISIRHDTLMGKVRIDIHSEDGLSSISKSFNVQE